MTMGSIISPTQAWSMLQRHADTDVKSLRLADLRSHENEDEVSSSFMAVHNSYDEDDGDGDGHVLILDWSRQRMTLETINHLLRLSTAKKIRDRIRDLAWGRLAPGSKLRRRSHHGNNHRFSHNSTGEYGNELPSSPTVSFAHDLRDSNVSHYHNNDKQHNGEDMDEDEEGGSMHLALRAPANKGLFMRDPYHCSERRSKSNKYHNALDEIHKEWRRIESLTESLRQGKIRGASGRPLCDVLVVAPAGAVVPHALEFVYRALMHNKEAEMASFLDSSLVTLKSSMGVGSYVGGGGSSGMAAPSSKSGDFMASTLQSTAGGVINMVTTPFRSKSSQDLHHGLSPHSSKPSYSSSFRRRKLKVLTSIDPSAFKEVLLELSPETTMVVSLDLDVEKEKECKEITLAVREWLLSGFMGSDGIGGSKETGNSRIALTETIGQKHMFLVTHKESLKRSNSQNIFLLPRHSRCEAFSTFSSAGLLPLSFLFGWETASSFLSGAHDMDQHFIDINPRQNLPLLLALIDFWNDTFLHSHGRVISPFVEFGSYPSFVAALENKVLNGCGQSHTTKNSTAERKQRPSPVIDGRSLCFGGSHELPSEFIMTFDQTTTTNSSIGTENDDLAKHDKMICSLFAHADAMAFGGNNSSNSRRFDFSPGSPPMIQSVDSMLSHSSANVGDTTTFSGNQPSTLISCGTCDAFTCGQLIALAEHRSSVKAWLWDIDPFGAIKSSIEEDRQQLLSDKLHQMNHLLSNGENLEEANESLFPGQNGAGDNDIDVAFRVHSTTKTALKRYAVRTQKYRHHSAPKTPLRMSS